MLAQTFPSHLNLYVQMAGHAHEVNGALLELLAQRQADDIEEKARLALGIEQMEFGQFSIDSACFCYIPGKTLVHIIQDPHIPRKFRLEKDGEPGSLFNVSGWIQLLETGRPRSLLLVLSKNGIISPDFPWTMDRHYQA